jgi:hypothetical protein
MGAGERPAVRDLVANRGQVLVLEMDVGEGAPVELHQAAHAFRAVRHLRGGGIVVAVIRVDERTERADVTLVEPLGEEPLDEGYVVGLAHGLRPVSGAASGDRDLARAAVPPRPAMGAVPPPVPPRAAREPRARSWPPLRAGPLRAVNHVRVVLADVPRCSQPHSGSVGAAAPVPVPSMVRGTGSAVHRELHASMGMPVRLLPET